MVEVKSMDRELKDRVEPNKYWSYRKRYGGFYRRRLRDIETGADTEGRAE